MGLYNIVLGLMICPRCGSEIDVEVETKLGYMSDLAQLRLGERYPWANAGLSKADGRPDGGNAVGDGYCVCSHCDKDFFVNVVVEADVIQRLEVDRSRPGYVPDL